MQTKMAAEPPAKLDYRSRCLVSQIVEHVKSQGIFDQFRRDCIEELEQKESYRQLKQRVESHVATFLSKQTWTDALPKNQVRDSLRRHINQSEVLERGVKQLISQALESKGKSFRTRIEGVVQNYIYMQHHQLSQDRRNPRYKVIDEKNEVKPSTSEAKQSVVCDITQLIPIPVPHSGASSMKTDSHVSDKAKYGSQDDVKGSVPSKGGQVSKRTAPSRTAAAVIKGEGRHVGSPSGSEKDRSSPAVEETSELQDDKCRSAKPTMENATCDEGQNASAFEQKVTARISQEVKLRLEPELTNSGTANDKSTGRKYLESDDNVKVASKNTEKFEIIKRVTGLWTAQSVTTIETAVLSKKDSKKELEESKEPLHPVESAVTMFTTGEGEINTASVPQHIDSNLNATDSKLIDSTEEKIEAGIGYSFSSSEKLVTAPYETPIAVTDSDNATVCKTESTSVKEADAEVPTQSDECKIEVSTVSCEPGLTVSSRDIADDLEHDSEAGDHSDVESDVSEVSSVHTSDLSSFDEEVSSLSGSYDDDGDEEGGERGENGDEDELAARGKCNTGEADGNDGTSSAQSERNKDAPTRRRSTRIGSRRSTKEDDDVFGNDRKVKNRSRDSPRRKRRGRRRRREEPPQMSEGQSESSPVKRRRGRPRKNERRISSSSDSQRRYSRWHSQDDSSSEASRIKRSQRKIKRTRCYSPSSEGTREVFLPCKRSRVGSKD